MRRRFYAVLLVVFVVLIALTLLLPKIGPIYRHPIAAARMIGSTPRAQLPVPVAGVRPRELRDTWNGPRSGGRKHRGIDIFARRGTPIRSTTRGIVATVGTNRLGGRIVRILGPGGEWHYYAHLESFGEIREGDVIAAGTVVGYVGDSGNARGTPPHLHYGIYRLHGGAMNPYRRLAAGKV
jgi:murein DD-endopeptidase MepM/ murein hydrolase activator NlpD